MFLSQNFLIMKMVLLLTKIFSASFLFLSVSPNLSFTNGKQNYHHTADKVFEKAAVISINGGDLTSGKLLLTFNGKDGHKVAANRGQKIQWLLRPNSNVAEIVAIEPKNITDNYNIFSEDPAPIGESKNWGATIAPDTDSPYEWYSIVWVDNDGAQHTDDPLIQVNPQIK